MSIARFLKHVFHIERSGLVNIDTEHLSLGQETQTIRWELARYPGFNVFYEYGDHEAILFIQERDQKENLMYSLLSPDADPCDQLSAFIGKLASIIDVASQGPALELTHLTTYFYRIS